MLTGERSVQAAADTVAFDKLTENDVALAYLPLAWVVITISITRKAWCRVSAWPAGKR